MFAVKRADLNKKNHDRKMLIRTVGGKIEHREMIVERKKM